MFDKWGKYEVNSIYTDFRSDVIAAGIVENGFDIDKVLILRSDAKSHRTDKEIESIEFKPDYEGDNDNVLVIKTNRYGIYDNLPEGIFHSADGLSQNSKEAIVESIRRQNEQEFFIRRFFSLFEAEVERSRTDIRLVELRYDRPGKHRNFVNSMLPFWPAIRIMDTQTAVLFTRTVPYLSDIRNSYTKTARAIATIMGYDVKIETEMREVKQAVKYPRLSVMRLGVNSILKGKYHEMVAVVKFQPNRESLHRMLPGMDKRVVAEALLEIFMPQNVNCEIRITSKPEDCTSRFGDNNEPCILGVNFRLGTRNSKRINEQE